MLSRSKTEISFERMHLPSIILGNIQPRGDGGHGVGKIDGVPAIALRLSMRGRRNVASRRDEAEAHITTRGGGLAQVDAMPGRASLEARWVLSLKPHFAHVIGREQSLPTVRHMHYHVGVRTMRGTHGVVLSFDVRARVPRVRMEYHILGT